MLIAVALVAILSGWRPHLSIGRDEWTTTTSVHSALLGRDMSLEVFLPPNVAKCAHHPVLFVFHGRGADQTQWMAGFLSDGVGVDRLVHRLIEAGQIRPVVIVSALIDDSYGVDSQPAADGYAHGPYEQYIVDELIPTVDARYDVGREPSERAVAGLSMGGFAALNAALSSPTQFGAVGALSPAFFVTPPADRGWIYRGHDLLNMADEGAADDLRVFLGYGDADYGWIRQATDALAAQLRDRGLEPPVVTVPGGHEMSTWRQLAEPMLLALFPPPVPGSSTAASC
jgi:enterochelin esterase-like enzyme